ncbi:MAG: hypothetical protein QOE42_2108, partial [Chloroflexota bacterium]|nr:hypothetical protein [Chloroflexota bacterium]
MPADDGGGGRVEAMALVGIPEIVV